ncbi:hypothetical protein [Pseudomonas sp. B392_1p]|uniref:hypothetical protein n=1 Tax=Pseudomonas sp. B392_1p TaxID=3457507 RepID=UPI003FCEF320
MIEERQVEDENGLYGRLLQRLGRVLEQADEPPGEMGPAEAELLELQGLSDAELELIRAYLAQDLQWLRGWHAAAEEMELIRRSSAGAGSSRWLPRRSLKRRFVRHPQLRCALCGVLSTWAANRSLIRCSCCGSQLFRAAGAQH